MNLQFPATLRVMVDNPSKRRQKNTFTSVWTVLLRIGGYTAAKITRILVYGMYYPNAHQECSNQIVADYAILDFVYFHRDLDFPLQLRDS